MPGWEVTIKYQVNEPDGIRALDAWHQRPRPDLVLVEEAAQYLCDDDTWRRTEELRRQGAQEAVIRSARALVQALLPTLTGPGPAKAAMEKFLESSEAYDRPAAAVPGRS